MSVDLFNNPGSAALADMPLAARMRPNCLQEYSGQEHLLGEGRPLRNALQRGSLHSMILWGPPGVGKTTLAEIIAAQCNAHVEKLSAVLSGVKEIRSAIVNAQQMQSVHNRSTILFVDEVHRFNKSQQDAFLPYVENGTVTFIGATTENPAFELNNALLSRCRVYTLKPLDDTAITSLLERAVSDSDRGLGGSCEIGEGALQLLVQVADGDARRALNFLEIACDLATDVVSRELVAEVVQGGGSRRFDRSGDHFYDQVSALHKSLRGSDPDASLYWFARLIDGGCDPLYIARRLVRVASEDIGNADPRALTVALQGWEVVTRLGSPEGELALAQTVSYLACAAKSNAVYKAFKQATSLVAAYGSLEVPNHLRNAPTQLAKASGHSEGYRYAHDEPNGFAAGEHYFPEQMDAVALYQPAERGLEQQIAAKLASLRAANRAASNTRFGHRDSRNDEVNE
ncbi:MAG: replication-associated recombination protein A [Porticoccaceae bacterium]